MSKKLAIKGHSTRGKEVIKLLEILGGVNRCGYDGNRSDRIYYISERETILIDDIFYINFRKEIDKFVIFTIEEFEQKFPYKVGDKVHNIIHNENKTITNLSWDFNENEIVYLVDNNEWVYVNYLQPYKEEIMEETMEEVDKAMAPNLVGEDYYGKRFGYKIPNGYEFDCIKNNEIILKLKQPQYPISFEECCKVLGISYRKQLSYTNPDVERGNTYLTKEKHLLDTFMNLRICQYAYWKIAGEEMGLDKPWETDWENLKQEKHCIFVDAGSITLQNGYRCQHILVFPTEEIRDVFYENFKDLIEQCKELL
jgi:hypothetical protein